MKYRYQLILLGSDVPIKHQILEQVYNKIKALGLSEEILKTTTKRQTSKNKKKQPIAF